MPCRGVGVRTPPEASIPVVSAQTMARIKRAGTQEMPSGRPVGGPSQNHPPRITERSVPGKRDGKELKGRIVSKAGTSPVDLRTHSTGLHVVKSHSIKFLHRGE